MPGTEVRSLIKPEEEDGITIKEPEPQEENKDVVLVLQKKKQNIHQNHQKQKIWNNDNEDFYLIIIMMMKSLLFIYFYFKTKRIQDPDKLYYNVTIDHDPEHKELRFGVLQKQKQ